MSPLTLNMPTPSQPSLTYHSNPNMQDEQAQLEVLALPGISMVDDEQHISSLTLDVMPTLTTQISSNHQPSDSVFNSHHPQIFQDHLNEVFMPHNCTRAAPFTLTLAQANGAKALGNVKNNPKAVEVDELVMGEMEIVGGEEVVVVVPYTHLHPVQLASLQIETTGGQHSTRLAKTPPPMMASWRPSII